MKYKTKKEQNYERKYVKYVVAVESVRSRTQNGWENHRHRRGWIWGVIPKMFILQIFSRIRKVHML